LRVLGKPKMNLGRRRIRRLKKNIPLLKKRKTRILEGSKARVESHNVGLSLIAAELVISVAGLYHVLNGWTGPESPFNLSDIRLYIPA
jgi:hypothetical protein